MTQIVQIGAQVQPMPVRTADAEDSNNSGRYPNPIHDEAISAIWDENSCEQGANESDPPGLSSPVLCESWTAM